MKNIHGYNGKTLKNRHCSYTCNEIVKERNGKIVDIVTLSIRIFFKYPNARSIFHVILPRKERNLPMLSYFLMLFVHELHTIKVRKMSYFIIKLKLPKECDQVSWTYLRLMMLHVFFFMSIF